MIMKKTNTIVPLKGYVTPAAEIEDAILEYDILSESQIDDYDENLIF